jgi:hypothetical protein
MPDELTQVETTNAESTPPEASETQAPESWDAFMEAQPEPVKALFQTHVQGLRTALTTEREERKSLDKRLRDVAKQLEDGSTAKTQLEQLSQQYEETEKRLAFYESAPPELTNAKLAWLAATELDAFDRKGNVNWDAVRQAYPELFKAARQAAPPANAGAGTQGAPQPFSMNDILRQAATRNNL